MCVRARRRGGRDENAAPGADGAEIRGVGGKIQLAAKARTHSRTVGGGGVGVGGRARE